MRYYLLLLPFLLFGCKAKIDWASECAQRYPVKETFIAGKPVYFRDTLTIKGDSIPCPEVEGKNGQKYTPKVKCPDQKYIKDSVVVHDTTIVEDRAKISLLEQENKATQAIILKEKETSANALKQAEHRTRQRNY